MDCRLLQPLVAVFAFSLLAGCGLAVPDIKEIWDKDIPADPTSKPYPTTKQTGTMQIEYEIEEKIFCELMEGVQEAEHSYVIRHYAIGNRTTVQKGLFPPNWAAQVALSLEVDETSALTPGVAINQVLPNAVNVFGAGAAGTVTSAQSFGLGLGGSFSSASTRTDKFNPYWSIADLMQPITPKSSCYRRNDPFVQQGYTPASSSPFIIESELGIRDWVVGAMLVDELIPSTETPPSTPQPSSGKSQSKCQCPCCQCQGQGQPQKRGQCQAQGQSSGGGQSQGGGQSEGGGGGGGPKPESISLELKFVIVTSGNVTPTWKLVKVSNSGSSPFFNTGRTRTHDLIITIGPPNQQTNNSHLAAQIGTAVGNANRQVLTSSPPLIGSP
jgi:hypothetical protein